MEEDEIVAVEPTPVSSPITHDSGEASGQARMTQHELDLQQLLHVADVLTHTSTRNEMPLLSKYACFPGDVAQIISQSVVGISYKSAQEIVQELKTMGVKRRPVLFKPVLSHFLQKYTNRAMCNRLAGNEGTLILNHHFPESMFGTSSLQVALQSITDAFAALLKSAGTYVGSTRDHYVSMTRSSQWGDLIFALCTLQGASIEGFKSTDDKERITWFVNLYNVLIMHGQAVFGCSRRGFPGAAYVVAGHRVSADEIMDVILRGEITNGGNEIVKRWSVRKLDARIHAVTKQWVWDGRVPVALAVETLETQLEDAMKGFVKRSMQIRRVPMVGEEYGEIVLHPIFRDYRSDFEQEGESSFKLIVWICNYLPIEAVAKMSKLTKYPYIITYKKSVWDVGTWRTSTDK